jgi:hypothetical protein
LPELAKAQCFRLRAFVVAFSGEFSSTLPVGPAILQGQLVRHAKTFNVGLPATGCEPLTIFTQVHPKPFSDGSAGNNREYHPSEHHDEQAVRLSCPELPCAHAYDCSNDCASLGVEDGLQESIGGHEPELAEWPSDHENDQPEDARCGKGCFKSQPALQGPMYTHMPSVPKSYRLVRKSVFVAGS